MDKDQQIHDIVLAYMAAIDAHKERCKHGVNNYETISVEKYAEKYKSYFSDVSSIFTDTTK